MILIKRLALVALIIAALSSCKKDEITTDYAHKLIGTYIGTSERYDTLTIDNKSAPTKYSSYIQAYVQRNKNAELQILYFVNTNAYYNSTYLSGEGKTEGVIGNISLTNNNLLVINENTVNFWGKTIKIKGDGIYDASLNSLILNLSTNDNGTTKPLKIQLVRQKTFNE